MLTAHNFSYGLVTPVLAYLMSCLGAFLGLRCTARAMATTGRERLRWLLLGALSIGTTGIWVMHFIAMLGYTVPGQIIHYNVLVTIASMLIAVVVTGIGLLIVGFGRQNWATLVLAGTFMGLGVATMHYTGMAAVRLTGRMTFSPTLFILSVIIAVVACTVALWFTTNLTGLRATLVAALIAGVAVSGMHYTGMAALHMWPAGAGGGMNMAGGGATAVGFLLPLLIGISILAFIMTATIALSPSSEEMREDAELLQRIAATQNGAYRAAPRSAASRPQHWPTQVVSRGTQARRQGASSDRPPSQ
ncbi:MAG TPA: MHYT domain-containing protein [Streptosporangiaceae bacterium]|nr:MHYT domain-containing protein [Streptosporangiaceae bacterium]